MSVSQADYNCVTTGTNVPLPVVLEFVGRPSSFGEDYCHHALLAAECTNMHFWPMHCHPFRKLTDRLRSLLGKGREPTSKGMGGEI